MCLWKIQIQLYVCGYIIKFRCFKKKFFRNLSIFVFFLRVIMNIPVNVIFHDQLFFMCDENYNTQSDHLLWSIWYSNHILGKSLANRIYFALKVHPIFLHQAKNLRCSIIIKLSALKVYIHIKIDYKDVEKIEKNVCLQNIWWVSKIKKNFSLISHKKFF